MVCNLNGSKLKVATTREGVREPKDTTDKKAAEGTHDALHEKDEKKMLAKSNQDSTRRQKSSG